jgi:hypothetical protein
MSRHMTNAAAATSSDRTPRRYRPETLLSLSAFMIGLAVYIAGGNQHPAALAYLAVSIAWTAWAVLGPVWPKDDAAGAAAGITSVALGACIVGQALLLVTAPAVSEAKAVLLPLLAAGAMSTVALVLPARRWLRVAAPALLLPAHLFAGATVIRATPEPVMDVFVFQSEASSALLNGGNPYAIDFPDLSYGTSPFYAPGVQVDGRLKFGFPYLPLSLLLAAPSYAVWGDVRYAHLVCMAAAGAFMAWSRRTTWAAAAAAFFLLAPSGFYVLAQGWTEALVVMLLAATVFCACRRPDLLPLALGLFFAVKQYTFLAAPLALLLVPQPWTPRKVWDVAWKAGQTALVVTLPFALWDPKAFWWSVVGVQLRQPFRPDALSFLAALANWKGVILPPTVAFVAMAAVEVLALRRAPRTPSGFAAAVALSFLVFFALNKQAFANYYYFVLGALACAVAASGEDRNPLSQNPTASSVG